MIEIDRIYKTKEEAAAFCSACEEQFETRLHAISTEIAGLSELRCVTLSGPSCSGKTTTAAKLTGEIERAGRRARVLSIDDFYLDSEEMQRRGITDFEGADSLDLAYFASTVEAISAGEKVLLPTFDFPQRKRIAYTEYQPDERDIYVFEGIQAIYPQITRILEPFGYKSIYISVEQGANVCGTGFDKNEIRLMRRIVRDFYHRDSSPHYTMALWDSVRSNEEKNIFPYVGGCDYVINSMLPYEIFLIGRYFLRITDDYPAVGPHYDWIQDLRGRLWQFSESAVDVSMIPMGSVFREFII